jgi:superfamily II DNA/RNA helicase
MNTEIDPIRFDSELQATFRRYLYTSNLICDSEPELQNRFWEDLTVPLRILNGPFIHCIPAYESAESLADLIVGKRSGLKLSKKFLQLPREQFDPARPLHRHQANAIEQVAAGRNLIVATGTGSGKTECFMLPILQSVFADPAPGLRAIIIYPMNALANDQLDRLRRLLAATPEVTFGRYTSDTPHEADDGEKERAGAIENERYSRDEIRQQPPHILLTNFAMLEYLLLRPRDADIFQGQQLRFLVLDEAHSYGGAQGIEIALLMRRLKEYLGLTPEHLQFVLTSATIGGPESTSEVVQFARDLSGQPFEERDLLRGETVTSFSAELKPFPTHTQLRSIIQNDADFERWTSALDDVPALHTLIDAAGFQPGPLKDRDPHRLLFDVFSRSRLMADLHSFCSEHALSFSGICKALDLPDDEVSRRGLAWLIALGANARPGPESAPLLPTRLHFFCRGLAGATVCLNDECDSKVGNTERAWSSFYLEDRKECRHCECGVLPVSTCVHCGMPIAHVLIRDNKWRSGEDDPFAQSSHVLLTWLRDMDEGEDGEDDKDDEKAALSLLCLSCHAYKEDVEAMTCCTTPALRRLRRIPPSDDDGNLDRCPRCAGGSGDFPSVLRSFVTGEDAPAAVLTETLMRNLPENPSLARRDRLPANGRNLLVFSDSRQRAAFFAPYLSHTMAETAYLEPIERALKRTEAREDRPGTVEEIAAQYIRDLNPREMPVTVIRSRDDSGLEHYKLVPTGDMSVAARTAARKEAQVSLFRHVCSSTKQRGTLTGLGIAGLAFDISEYRWDEIMTALPQLFTQGQERGRELVEVLLGVFAQKGAIAFPEPLETRDVLRFGTHTAKAYTFSRTQSGKIDGRLVARWNPYLAPANARTNAINKSRQLGVLARALALDRQKDEAILSDLLNKLWRQFVEAVLVSCEQWDGEYRLDSQRIQLTARAKFFACDVCGRLTTAGRLGFCASPDCMGTPLAISGDDAKRRFERNHYRTRYLLKPLPLEVREHTAQLTNRTGKDYQERFIRGEVNVLSSSTTFEMGVDVGGLKAVLLRNVPPKSSNYVQRAGRAGRRKDGVSVVVTYARNAPHDQYLYQNAEMIIEGQMRVPIIHVTNPVLAQRHANSLLLGYFLRALVADGMDARMLDRAKIADFFLDDHDGAKLVERFGTWLSDKATKKNMLERLAKVLPDKVPLTAADALKESIESLSTRPNSVLRSGVEAVLERFNEQLVEVRKQEMDPATPLNQRQALSKAAFRLERLIEQFRIKTALIDFLSSESWLPGYAFPQNVVKLLVRHAELEGKMRLERDREVGIAEYAPGSEIVADGHLLRSGAVWFKSREPDVRFYTRCPQCRKISTYLETEQPQAACTRCGTQVIAPPKRYIKPDAFSTLASDAPIEPGMFRKRPPRNSDVFLLEGSEEFQDHAIAGVSYGIRRSGKMFRANSGYRFRGFNICRKCGRWFEGAPKRPHETPWGSQCSGQKIELHLAHELVTDILQLRFNQCTPPAPKLDDKEFWLSFQSAFLNGCCDALGIDANDLGATFNGWQDGAWIGELVIYDRVPGGAGHIERIVDNLDDVLRATLSRVEDCKGCSDAEASCYACLRTYSNQSQWAQLKRAPVIHWLSAVLSS